MPQPGYCRPVHGGDTHRMDDLQVDLPGPIGARPSDSRIGLPANRTSAMVLHVSMPLALRLVTKMSPFGKVYLPYGLVAFA